MTYEVSFVPFCQRIFMIFVTFTLIINIKKKKRERKNKKISNFFRDCERKISSKNFNRIITIFFLYNINIFLEVSTHLNTQFTSENSNSWNFQKSFTFLHTNNLKISIPFYTFLYLLYLLYSLPCLILPLFHLLSVSSGKNSAFPANRQTLIVLIRSRSRARQPRFNVPRFLVAPFIHWWRIMHAAISIRSNSILVRGRRARRVEFPYRPPADGMEMRGWKTTRLELYLDASFSVSCRVSREKKLKRKSSGRPHYLTVLLLKIPRKHFIIRRRDFFFPRVGELILASLNESDKIRGSRNF